MKNQHQTAIEHLKHALTFLQEARNEQYGELREQHLDEVERLIEYAKGLLENERT